MNIYKIIHNFILILARIISFIKNIIISLLKSLISKFAGLRIPEKLIVINTIAALPAIVLPVAKFKIFESFYYVNNPLGVYLIGIIIIILISFYFKSLVKLIIRLAVNVYYLFWIIYIPLAGKLTKANPHEISFGYYLNIAVPALYILFGIVVYFNEKER